MLSHPVSPCAFTAPAVQGFANDELRASIVLKEEPPKVFANHPKREQLHARYHQKDTYRRGPADRERRVGETLDYSDCSEHEAKNGKAEAGDRRNAQWQNRKIGEHVHPQSQEFAQGIA